MQKIAIVTGSTGQDGQCIIPQLIERNIKVFALVRRRSDFPNLGSLEIYKGTPNFEIFEGDVTDLASMIKLCKTAKADYFYHLAAQSHVGTSFDQKALTTNTIALGTLNCLEAIRESGIHTRFYNAATSELFGGLVDTPRNEDSPFHPRSPYGVAKLYAYWITINFRETYKMFASNGILFNHESILKNSPIIVRDANDLVDILPIEDIFRSEGHRYEGILNEYVGREVWDGEGWTRIMSGTCYKDSQKSVRLIQTREACCETTLDHVVFTEDGCSRENQDVHTGDFLFRVMWPNGNESLGPSENLCRFLGFLVGDGSIAENGVIRLTGTDRDQLKTYADLLCNQFGWTYSLSNSGPGQFEGCSTDIWQLSIKNDLTFGKWLRGEIYTNKSKEKRVPSFILNARRELKIAFWDGYYDADGRKAGHETYKYKGFTTKSATLCLGLLYIFRSFSSQNAKCKCDYRDREHRYYYVQFDCGYPTSKGAHLVKEKNEVVLTSLTESSDGWFFDIQTESQSFATGASLVKIHNSPFRGPNFVTRKITKAIAAIKGGHQSRILLGNLDAKRDWGWAPDFTRGMQMILEHKEPGDFVLATGETHSVREFCQIGFEHAGLGDYQKYVVVDPNLYRPAEVNVLIGDYSYSERTLGWKPTVRFEELVKRMVDWDIRNYRLE